MNNFYNNIPSSGMQGWYNSNPVPAQNDGFMNTNVNKVTSLEEAIMKSNMRLSETVYFHQTKNEFYNIRVDAMGNKTWQTFEYNTPNTSPNSPITKADFEGLVGRVVALENKFVTEKEGAENG